MALRADTPVQYGPRLTAVVVYLLVTQFGAQRRAAQAVADLFGVPLARQRRRADCPRGTPARG